ncbi:Stomatal closure-related actin-binding protein, coiled-coil domain [Dillenia turbinata]|uniref:Stomatal closure-related actin-binding protein, coiled-coil domain n=1 Tax=Dillenia turbinata TaxID=194707 RepID=A0AAN8VWD2_9MAGN
MTKVSPECEDTIEIEAVHSVSADVSFPSNHFPKYKIGPNNQILHEAEEEDKGPPLKEIIAQENAQLLEQQKRLSVRDLANKFDKSLATAAKLSDEAKLREVASLEGHVLLKKLRDALEALRGRLAGRNKDDVEKAISMVEALAVKLTQREGELIQEKFEAKKLANFLKQASEDAKKLVNQEKSFACAEIESARAVVQRFSEALEEQEKNPQCPAKQDIEHLMEEVQEARRIKLMHQPSKVMDMEHEVRALRLQIREKSIFSVKLQKELVMNKRVEEKKFCLYEFNGFETLGSCLQILPCSEKAPELSKSSIKWYRVSPDGGKKNIISGANKPIYAPEPFDVGQILQADITSNSQKVKVSTSGPIEQAAGLGNYVEGLMPKPNAEFNVVISQMNGQDYSFHSIHIFHVGKIRMKLCKGWITKARESYSTSMQLCGVRGGGNAAAKALYWQARRGLSFVIAFETERDRNAAILLARKYASDCNVVLAGPGDQVMI